MSLPHKLAQTAYIKLVLHVLKYPSQAVNGVLLGKASAKGCTDPVEIIDAVPLFHSQLALAPMLEIALAQVDKSATDQGLCIVGYYQANERNNDNEFGAVARKIAERIHSNCEGACALLIDNSKLNKLVSSKPPLVVQLVTRDSSRSWKIAAEESALTLQEPTATSLLADYAREGRHKRIVDFQSHLEDISSDWLNPDIMK